MEGPPNDQQSAAAPVDAHADRTRNEGHPRVRLGLARCPRGRHPRPDGHGDNRDGTSALVARRNRYTGEISFFRCWTPEDVTLAQLVEVICRWWRIEETFQLGKTFTGMDQGQVTCWNSWMRWSLFSLAASAVLALTTAATTTARPAQPALLVPLTCPELVRLLRAFVLTPPVRDAEHILNWMAWRRHQSSHRASLLPTPKHPSGPAMIRTTAAVSEWRATI